MKARTFYTSRFADACARMLTGATGGRKPAQVADIISRVAEYERLSAPIVMEERRGAPFRSAVSFHITRAGSRSILDPRYKSEPRMRPDMSLVLMQDHKGSIHPLALLDPDLTPSRAADDIRMRLSKRPIGRWRKFGLLDEWLDPALHADTLATAVRKTGSAPSLPGLAPLIRDLLSDLPVRAPFDGVMNSRTADGRVIGFDLKAKMGGRSLSAWTDGAAESTEVKSVRAGQTLGIAANQRVLIDRLAESYRHLIADMVSDNVHRLNRDAATAFLDLLDPRVSDAMSLHGESSISLYNWMAACSDDRRLAVRRQAYESYPLLVSALAASRPEVLACVDEEAEFVECVSAALMTSRRVVRSLRGVGPGDFGIQASPVGDPGKVMLELLGPVCHLPDGHLPSAGGSVSSGQQWKALAMTAIGTRRAKEFLDRGSSSSTGRTAGHERPTLEESLVELRHEIPFWLRKSGMKTAKAVQEGSWHIDELRHHFAVSLLFPILRDLDHDWSLIELGWSGLYSITEMIGSDGTSAIQRTLTRSRSPAALAKIANDYMEGFERIPDNHDESLAWPSWCETRAFPTRRGKVYITPLTTARDLAAEGAALDHCVGSYVRAASSGICHIFSVRDEGGRRLSTIDLRVEDDGFRIVQHEGAGHAPPPQEACQAADDWMTEIRCGRLSVIPFRPPNSPETRWTRHIGYDPSHGGMRDRSIKAWGFALPPAERGLTHAAWAELHGLPELLAEVISRRYLDAAPGSP